MLNIDQATEFNAAWRIPIATTAEPTPNQGSRAMSDLLAISKYTKRFMSPKNTDVKERIPSIRFEPLYFDPNNTLTTNVERVVKKIAVTTPIPKVSHEVCTKALRLCSLSFSTK
jgi:hypothetical protein